MATYAAASFVLSDKVTTAAPAHTYDPADGGNMFIACILIEDSGGAAPATVTGTPTWRGSTTGVVELLNVVHTQDLRLYIYSVDLADDTTSGSFSATLNQVPAERVKISFVTVEDGDVDDINVDSDAIGFGTSGTIDVLTQGTDAFVFSAMLLHANYGSVAWGGLSNELNEDDVGVAANSHAWDDGTGASLNINPVWTNSRRFVVGGVSVAHLVGGPTQPTIDGTGDGTDDDTLVLEVTSFADATSHVLRSSDDDVAFVDEQTGLAAGPGLSSIVETGIVASTTKYYRLRSSDGTLTTDSVSFTFVSPPEAPTNLILAQNPSSISVNFTDNTSGLHGHIAFRKLSTDTQFDLVHTFQPGSTSWVDEDITGGLNYDYRVHAFDPNATTLLSRPANAALLASTPVDGIILGDTATNTAVILESVSDGLSVGDSTTEEEAQAFSAVDGISIGDAVTETVIGPIRESVTDGLSFSDTTQLPTTYRESVVEIMMLSDAVQDISGENTGGGVPGGSEFGFGNFPFSIADTVGARTFLFEFHYSGGIIRATAANQDIAWNNEIWTAVGGRMDFDAIPSGPDRLAQTVSVELFGVDQAIIATLLSNQFRGRIAKIYLIELGETSGDVLNVREIWRGLQLSEYSIEEKPPTDDEPGFAVVKTKIASRLNRLSELRSIKNNPESHAEALRRVNVTITDSFFLTVSSLENRRLVWGGEQTSTSTGGYTGGGTRDPDED